MLEEPFFRASTVSRSSPFVDSRPCRRRRRVVPSRGAITLLFLFQEFPTDSQLVAIPVPRAYFMHGAVCGTAWLWPLVRRLTRPARPTRTYSVVNPFGVEGKLTHRPWPKHFYSYYPCHSDTYHAFSEMSVHDPVCPFDTLTLLQPLAIQSFKHRMSHTCNTR